MTTSDHKGASGSSGERAGISRRRVVGLAGLTIAGLGIAGNRAIARQSDLPATPSSTPPILPSGPGEMPTTGGSRPGPVSDEPPARQTMATIPATIIIPAAGIDAEIEVRGIVDGRMEDPTGPWVVSWYQQSAELGEVGNALFAGHVDYWGVGPSVFYNVRNLAAGDEISITGEDGASFAYGVEWVETIPIEELISGRTADVVAPTPYQAVTLFTCGGEFDYVNGEYLSRTVVRARRLPPAPDSTPTA